MYLQRLQPTVRYPSLAARNLHLRPRLPVPHQSFSSPSQAIPRQHLRRLVQFLLFAGCTLPLIPTVYAESPIEMSSARPSIESAPTLTLLRSYFVYTLCCVPLLVDYSPSVLHSFTHSPIPGLKSVTEGFVRRTFFAQFVPGETVQECRQTMTELRSRQVACALNYSAEAEVESGDAQEQRKIEEKRFEELSKAIDDAGHYEDEVAKLGFERGSTAFAIKLSGLIDPDVLKRASTTLLRLRPLSQSLVPSSPRASESSAIPYPGAPLPSDRRVVLGEGDMSAIRTLKGGVEGMGVLEQDEGIRDGDFDALKTLWGKVKSIGERARKQRIILMIDAEHTYYQPALDAYTLMLSEEFNRPPTVPSLPSGGKSSWNGPLI
ncbi:MAG: hypothetical protein TREMPRED_004769, partial [Tremellales sp. Tagirdzhanova-0007]